MAAASWEPWQDAVGLAWDPAMPLPVAARALAQQATTLGDLAAKAEEERQQAETKRRHFERLFEYAPDAYLVTDRAGGIQAVNIAAERMLGASRAHCLGRSLLLYTPIGERAVHRKVLEQLPPDGAARTMVMQIVQPPTGPLTVEAQVSASGSNGSEPRVVLWILRDLPGRLTEDRVDRQVWEAAQNAAKDEILTLISHELRTPLTVIMGFAEILRVRRRDLTEADQQELIAEIWNESMRLQSMVENVLVLGRPDVPVEPEPVMLQHELVILAGRHRQRFPERNVMLELSPNLPPAFADRDCLARVFRNLLGNAEKYSPASEPIVIRAEPNDNGVRVAVIDGGVGLIITDYEKLFEPFFRADATSEVMGGVGLGLAACKRMVESLGGNVHAQPRDNGGMEFAFTLPVAKPIAA